MQPPASARSSERAQARFARIAVTPGEVSEWSKVLDSKSSVAQATGGSNPPLSANARPVPDHCSTQCSGKRAGLSDSLQSGVSAGVPAGAPVVPGALPISGEVTEWSKVHDWKSCVSKGTEGSNPSLSANHLRQAVRAIAPETCRKPAGNPGKQKTDTLVARRPCLDWRHQVLWSQMAQGL
jgi:hypothetical protein